MRIECITAETNDRYLPVLIISEEDKHSEISELAEQDANVAITLATEESTVTVLGEDSVSVVVENDDTSDKTTTTDSMDSHVHKKDDENVVLNEQSDSIEEKTTIHGEDSNDSDDCSEDTINNEDHDAELLEPITVDGMCDVNSEVKFGENAEDTTEKPDAVEKTDNESAFRSEDAWESSLFKEDEYEEEYGNMVAPRIQKIKKKTASPAKKTLKKNPTIEKTKVSYADPVAAVYTSNAINHHFETNGFLVVESSSPQTIEGLKNLTYLIGENFSNTAPLLKEVRKAICTPNSKGDRNIIFKFDRTAGSFYHQFCGKMKQFGLFTKYFINGNVLTATISSVPRVISYLNGQWLEMYASFILEDVVSEYAKNNGYEYEILTNVKVTNITSVHVYAHEIDCVISIGDKCFAYEMKSGGQFDDYSGLYKTRKELRFVPDRYLLLSTELDEEAAEVLQYFYEFYITGMSGFKNRLIEMINKAFAN